MSTSKTKTWLLVGVGSVVAVAAAVYGFRWISHQQTRKVIDTQVEAWAKDWRAARACIAGDDTTFAGAGHAYLLYEATHTTERNRLDRCEPLIRKLKRPGSESTGVDAVEASWDNVREATKKLSSGFVGVIDKSTHQPMGPRRARLAEALDGMDAAYARLRRDGGMSAPTAPGTMAGPAPVSSGANLALEGVAVQAHGLAVDGDAVLIDGVAGERMVHLAVRGPDAIQASWRGAQAEPAADDSRWGVWTDVDESERQRLLAADLDAAGEPTGPGAVAYAARAPTHTPFLRMALGKDAVRAVFFEVYVSLDPSGYDERSIGLFMARSTDRGATWSDPVQLTDAPKFTLANVDQQRFDAAWFDADGTTRWLPVRAAALGAMPQPKRLFQSPGFDALALCTYGDSAWWVRNLSVLYHASKDGNVHEIALPTDAASPTACSAERALLTVPIDGGVQVLSCDGHACEKALDVPLSSSSSFAVGLGATRGPAAVTQTNDLVLLFQPGAAPAAFALDGEYQVRGLVEWGGAWQLLASPLEKPELYVTPLPDGQGSGS